MAAWFESWFDSKYYHILYDHRDESEANRFIDNLLDRMGLAPGSLVLDAACGKGRHARRIHNRGYKVTGIDLSPNSIEQASLPGLDGLTFEVADLRDFDLGRKFDLVCNLFTSFGYFESIEDNRKVLGRFRQHLNVGGLLLIDYLNPDWVRSTLVPHETVVKQDISFHISREVNQSHVIKRIRVGGEQDLRFEERVSVFSRADFEVMLMDAGFELIDTFGGYSLESYDEQNSRRMILLAKAT